MCEDRQIRFTNSKGEQIVSNGGKCIFKKGLASGFFGSLEKLQSKRDAFVAKFITKKQFDKKFGWTEKHHFGMPEPEEFKAGFVCSGITPSFPHSKNIEQSTRMIFDKDLKQWRHSTHLDRVCNPDFIPGTGLSLKLNF